jgi:hypothetical protein
LALTAIVGGAGCASLPAAERIPLNPSNIGEARVQPAVGTKRKDLVYVSAGSSVLVYEYGMKTELFKLPDFTDARGSCSDANGNVYVTNFGAADILEFRHGASKPTRILLDPEAYPVDCSVDPKTGDLAVLNEYGKIESTPGDLAVYANAKGKPKIYKDSSFTELIACGYDGNGDLIVSGYSGNSLIFAILPAGGTSLQAFSPPLGYQYDGPAYIRWDGKYLVIEFRDYNDGFIFVRYTISDGSAREEGTTTVELTGVNSGPFWVGKTGTGQRQAANAVVVATADYGVYIWSYPQGTLLYELGYGPDTYGAGVTISRRE